MSFARTETWQSHLLGSQPKVLICIDNSPSLYNSSKITAAKKKAAALFKKHEELALEGKLIVTLFNSNSQWREIRKFDQLEEFFSDNTRQEQSTNPWDRLFHQIDTSHRPLWQKTKVYLISDMKDTNTLLAEPLSRIRQVPFDGTVELAFYQVGNGETSYFNADNTHSKRLKTEHSASSKVTISHKHI